MEEVFRSLVGRFNESVRGYLKPRRKNSRLPVVVSIKPDIYSANVVRNRQSEVYVEKKNLSVEGETSDISEGGISFIVPFIRLGQHYLVGADTDLELTIDLPNGQLKLTAQGCRYKQIDPDSSVSRYLVGARITGMSDKDKILFGEYLANSQGRAKSQIKNVEWGLDMPRS